MTQSQAIEKTRDVIRLKHLSLATEDCYLGWLGRFMAWLPKAQPGLTSEKKVEAFLTVMAKRGCAASTQNQAFNALLFFYQQVLGQKLEGIHALRATRPVQIRTAPSVDEVRQLFATLADVHGYPTRLIARMIYGCGMRVCEPLNLRVKDVEISQSRLILRGAKGGKDRMIALPCSLVVELQSQLRAARVVWERDVRNQIPVKLPGLLAAKYPHWRFAWNWAFVFPSHQPCADPRTGETVRYRCHEANVQRAVKLAARAHGLCLTPHHLRHAYATHVIQSGANIRDVQEAMGHAHMDTTAGYITPRALGVGSPLEMLA
jgi:integron integrase